LETPNVGLGEVVDGRVGHVAAHVLVRSGGRPEVVWIVVSHL
jgi:hypothetical protein